MVGLNIPVIPVEHQYIVTEAHPDIQARHRDGKPEMGVLRDSEGQWYMREEAGGLILGPYEKARRFVIWMGQVMIPNMNYSKKI
jgi:dimethylglycine dehydrogenase